MWQNKWMSIISWCVLHANWCLHGAHGCSGNAFSFSPRLDCGPFFGRNISSSLVVASVKTVFHLIFNVLGLILWAAHVSVNTELIFWQLVSKQADMLLHRMCVKLRVLSATISYYYRFISETLELAVWELLMWTCKFPFSAAEIDSDLHYKYILTLFPLFAMQRPVLIDSVCPYSLIGSRQTDDGRSFVLIWSWTSCRVKRIYAPFAWQRCVLFSVTIFKQ